LFRVGATLAIACTARGAEVSLPQLKIELGADVLAATADDLPPPFTSAEGPLPPLGRAFGALTIVDERLAAVSALAFDAFSSTMGFEVPYDDYCRLERPRFAAFAIGGELPARTEEGPAVRRTA